MDATRKSICMRNGRISMVVLAPYWNFWEHTISRDVRAERAAEARRVALMFGDEFQVLATETVSSPEESVAAAIKVKGSELDVVLVLSSMAVPPLTVTAFVDSFER